MSEMALTADHIIVVGRGTVVADAPVEEIVARAGADSVRVRTPQLRELAAMLDRAAATVTQLEADLIEVVGLEAPRVGEIAASAGLVLHELTPVQGSLEEAYMQLTADEVEYTSVLIPEGALR